MTDPRGERIVGYITLYILIISFISFLFGWMGVGGIRTYGGAVVHSDSRSVRLAHIGDQPACHTTTAARPW
jgi:hypothetical protein